MKVEEFANTLDEKYGDEYGILAPPTSDGELRDILIEHFLGDYVSVNPISREQFNTEAIFRILEEYPGYEEKNHKGIINKIKNLFK